VTYILGRMLPGEYACGIASLIAQGSRSPLMSGRFTARSWLLSDRVLGKARVGAWVDALWMGLDVSSGVGAEPPIFDTHVSAFGNQPYLEWSCPTDTQGRARALHDRVVSYVQARITPPAWDLGEIFSGPTLSIAGREAR
jgi:hypothetical protein